MRRASLGPGRAAPLGASPEADGVNFAVAAGGATRVELCLFDGRGRETRLDLPEREGDIWHGFLPGAGSGTVYGYRAHGPWRPHEGQVFNPAKLLLDPYARQLTGHPIWSPALFGYRVENGQRLPDPTDSAAVMAKGIVAAPFPPAEPGPRVPVEMSVIYEAHLKGLTWRMPGVAQPGRFAALAEPRVIAHLRRLGVTAVELLPVHAFITDGFLQTRGLTNYWGYQTLSFFAPDPRYGTPAEARAAVAALHEAGIEVILDVVYNHSCEGDELGPTLSFRGLDNAGYYRLTEGGRHHVNDTGTGNTLNLEHPAMLRLALDSLRYWASEIGVDGFRFDLAATLGRRASGFDANAPFLAALRADPVLARVKLIAEPWDIGPGGYRLGAFPPPFLEWNDRYRDGVRGFWRGDAGAAPGLAARITGSAGEFDHSGRPATSSVNFLAAHDGFTLEDVVSFALKHNEANGEENRDGHNHNLSDNLGHEGPTADPGIRAARDRRKRAMIATLMLSQGTPMLLAGDEMGRTQGGNNNAYAQDNETSWIDWAAVDEDLVDFTARLIAFRKAHPVLRQRRFLHARERAEDGAPDIVWHHVSGRPMQADDWRDGGLRIVIAELRMASGTPAHAEREEAVLAVFNAGGDVEVVLPRPMRGRVWRLVLDSADPGRAEPPATRLTVSGQSVAVLVQERAI